MAGVADNAFKCQHWNKKIKKIKKETQTAQIKMNY